MELEENIDLLEKEITSEEFLIDLECFILFT